jgi:hypothetical protein
VLVALAAAGSPGIAQQTPQEPAPSASDTLALCTAWHLTAKAIEVAAEVQGVAADRLERAQKAVEECAARQNCAREERVNHEQELRETRYQQAQASKLAAAMEQRRTDLRRLLEQARGAGAAEKCGEG